MGAAEWSTVSLLHLHGISYFPCYSQTARKMRLPPAIIATAVVADDKRWAEAAALCTPVAPVLVLALGPAVDVREACAPGVPAVSLSVAVMYTVPLVFVAGNKVSKLVAVTAPPGPSTSISSTVACGESELGHDAWCPSLGQRLFHWPVPVVHTTALFFFYSVSYYRWT